MQLTKIITHLSSFSNVKIWILNGPYSLIPLNKKKLNISVYFYSGTKAQFRNSNRDKRLGNEDKDWVIETKIRLA